MFLCFIKYASVNSHNNCNAGNRNRNFKSDEDMKNAFKQTNKMLLVVEHTARSVRSFRFFFIFAGLIIYNHDRGITITKIVLEKLIDHERRKG